MKGEKGERGINGIDGVPFQGPRGPRGDPGVSLTYQTFEFDKDFRNGEYVFQKQTEIHDMTPCLSQRSRLTQGKSIHIKM